MDLYTPTREEMNNLTIDKLLKEAKTRFWMITLGQWRNILARNITGKMDLFTRVNNLFDTTPLIGITPDGKIVIRTSGTFDTNKMNMDWTWITNAGIGTLTNTKVKAVAVDVTTPTVTGIVLETLMKFLSLTTDDLTNVPKIEFSHNVSKLTKGSWTYFGQELNATPIPEGAKWITRFALRDGHGMNSIEVTDEREITHSGQWNLSEGIIYDAITVAGAITSTQPSTQQTSI